MKFTGFLLVGLLLLQCSGCNKEDKGMKELAQRLSTQFQQDLGGLLKFNITVNEIKSLCSAEQAKVKQALDQVAALSPDKVTFENSVAVIEKKLAAFSVNIEPATFLKYVSPDATLREAADECEQAVRKLYVDIYAREDLYRVLKAVKASQTALSDIEKRLVREYEQDFQNNGLELPAEERKKFIEKKKKLVELTTEFDKNLVEWKDPLLATKDELDGMSEDFINSLEKTDDGKYKLTLAYPHYFPAMRNLKNADVRRRLQVKFFNRGGDRNTQLMEQAISLRHELANMLGKSTHAEFRLERRMAKSPQKVTEFLTRLRTKLKPLGQKDIDEYLKLKREEMGDPSIGDINSWDWRYYANQLSKKKYQVDHEKIKEYFPLDTVVNGMLETYELMLDVDFIELNGAPKWHDSVKSYAVVDRKTTKTLSYFYMDLFPRDGKYKHAAAFTLLQGHKKADGNYQTPVSSIVANFNPPTQGKPSLLLHSQVETLFHELGHIMHQVLTKSDWATFSGTSVKRDFVEAPSQMLENWVWKKESLKKLSGHFSDPSQPLPDELLNKLVAAKLANVGIRYLRQIFFATLDMTYHTAGTVDTTAVYQKLIKEIMLIPIPNGTQPQASFGHLMGGYDAGYYGYLWSEVFAQDMFTRFEKEGLLSPTVGADYRKWILEPGGSLDPLELITQFIGREPNEDAFLKSLGLSS